MNILYTCDNNYIWLTIISIISLLQSNKNVEINIYLIGENISKENKELLSDIVIDYNKKCTIIDLPKINVPQKLYSKRWPKSAFTRLYCAEILPKGINNILYLDGDTIIKGDISEIFKNKNNEYIVYGVKDCISKEYRKNIGIEENDVYINGGVLYFNLEKLRKININAKIEDFLNKYDDLINYADQDILNGIFKKKIGVLSPQYDLMTIEFSYKYEEILKIRNPINYYKKEEIEKAILNPIIIHYSTNMTIIRPWYKNSNHPRKEDFLEILKYSPYNNKELIEYEYKRKDKILNFLLHFPKCLRYNIIGFLHGSFIPKFNRLKNMTKRS